MSRFNFDGYSEDFPNASALWWTNCERAVEGKRGQKVLRLLKEALLSLPTKRLVSSTIVDTEGSFCTVGAYAAHVETLKGKTLETTAQEMLESCTRCTCGHDASAHSENGCTALRYGWSIPIKQEPCTCTQYDINYEDTCAEDTADFGTKYGLKYALAWRLAYLNDEELALCTPEERYAKVLDWIERNLKR